MATAKTRVFTRDELDEIGVPFECGAFDGSAEELHAELCDTTRWNHVYEFIFWAPDDGKAYRAYYEVGATEMQDADLWNWEKTVTAYEVEPKEVITTEWVAVTEDDV